jgi:endonuclease/exonuclease/phosphatase family metal-dependent hydrolase
MRLTSFNVENLFSRPKAMSESEGDDATRSKVLGAHARVSELFALTSYAGVEDEILAQLELLGLVRVDEGEFARLRKLRGQLLSRHRDGTTEVVASGRADWVGWVELKTIAVNEEATKNTARVIADLDSDVMTVVEADNRPGLDLFSQTLLREIGSVPYDQVMVVEGNDLRGIDVGFMAKAGFELVEIRTHIFDEDDTGPIFSRDCCEYHVETPEHARLVVLANHFKSKGYSSPGDPIGANKRLRQATRVAEIYEDLVAEGFAYIAIMGDLNDSPSSLPLQPLRDLGALHDASEHPDFDWNHRKGTYGSGNEDDKIDYIWMSDPLFDKVTGGGVFRKGVYRGSGTSDPWEIYQTLTSRTEEASDHAAIYADVTDF